MEFMMFAAAAHAAPEVASWIHRAGSWMVSGDRPPFFPCVHKSPLSGQVDISCSAVRKTSQQPQESVQLQKSLFLVYLLTLPLAQLIPDEGLVTYECLPVMATGGMVGLGNFNEKLDPLYYQYLADYIDHFDEVASCYSGTVL